MRIRTITSRYKKKHEHLELYPDRQLVIDEIIACLSERKLWLTSREISDLLHCFRQQWANGHAGACEWDPQSGEQCQGKSTVRV